MANRYWIGDGGSWSDTAHWSTTSGGAGGASAATTTDVAIFDTNSFSLAGQVVTITGTRSVASFDSSTVTNSPTLTITGTSSRALSVFGNANFTGFLFTLITGSSATNAIRLRGTGATTITTGGAQLPTVKFENGNAGAVVYTFTDNLTIQSGQIGRFSVTTDAATVGMVATGKTFTIPNCEIATNDIFTFDDCTINVTENFYLADYSTFTCNGTTWNITGNIVNQTTDATLSILKGGSTSSLLTMSNNSGATQEISRVTMTNTRLNGTNGFRMVEVIDGGGNDWSGGGGGGGGGGPVRQYHVKVPPDHIQLT